MSYRSHLNGHFLAVAALLLLCLAPLVPAYAANSGIDTPTGITTLPFGIEGVEMMDLTTTGLAIGTPNPTGHVNIYGESGGLGLNVQADDGTGTTGTRVRQLFISGASNPNVKAEIGLDTTLKELIIGVLEEGVAWHDIILANNGGFVGIGTLSPQGNLDIENGSNTATLCLNGSCKQSVAPTVVTATGSGSPVNGNVTSNATATCPAGKHATGGGANCSCNQPDPYLTGSYPELSGSTPIGWTAQCECWGIGQPGYYISTAAGVASSSTTVYALCE
jgi:hypothetical protein